MTQQCVLKSELKMLDFEEKGHRESVSEEIRDLEVRKHTYTYYIYLFTYLC